MLVNKDENKFELCPGEFYQLGLRLVGYDSQEGRKRVIRRRVFREGLGDRELIKEFIDSQFHFSIIVDACCQSEAAPHR